MDRTRKGLRAHTEESLSCFICSDGQAGVNRTDVRSVGRESGMAGASVGINAVNSGIPAADRTVQRRENEERSAGLAVLRDCKVGRVRADVSDGAGRCAKGPRRAAWCRRYCHKEWNLLTSSSIESGEPGAIVTDPERTAGKCSETPGVDQVLFVSSRRHSRLIRY